MPAAENLELALETEEPKKSRLPLAEELAAFCDFGKPTRTLETLTRTSTGASVAVPTYLNEFWTSRQRAASSLHEISYRACFKPQLPRFFIQRLSRPGDAVYDPFMGRGTTAIESALLGRVPCGCDINPVSALVTRPRLNPPTLEEIVARLGQIDLRWEGTGPDDLLVFYHPETLREICALREYLIRRRAAEENDPVDDWIGMIALNRLTGHSPGFFSVYTLPPNQAVSVESQRKINKARGQTPPRRDVSRLILKKSKQILMDCSASVRRTVRAAGAGAWILTGDASRTPQIADSSVALVVTSPPFLDVVNYAADNWLRCWFAGIDSGTVQVTMAKKLEDWQAAMREVFRELWRVLRPGGFVAFEVGEVQGGRVKLEEAVIPCAAAANLRPVLILINDQKFTKTANCWGVDNNAKGTNTNRIVVLEK